MPAVKHGDTCNCCAPAPASQSLAEVAFAKSAAAAAQAGDLFRVKQLIALSPAALHDDGCGGAFESQAAACLEPEQLQQGI